MHPLALVGVVAVALHRQLCHLAGEGHLPDVVSYGRADGDDVALVELDPFAIDIVSLAGILELHLDEVRAL